MEYSGIIFALAWEHRIASFLPSLMFAAGIAIIGGWTLSRVAKRYEENFRSIAWQRAHPWTTSILSIVLLFVIGPTTEELLFRAPIIVAFDRLTPSAWIGILMSSTCFGVLHWFGAKVSMVDVGVEQQFGRRFETDDARAAVAEITAERAASIPRRRLYHVATTFLGGILFGYVGIRTQSLWGSIAMHAAWNLVMPFALLLFAIILWPLLTGCYWTLVGWWQDVWDALGTLSRPLRHWFEQTRREDHDP